MDFGFTDFEKHFITGVSDEFYSSDFSDIVELTYAYDEISKDIFYNKTLFTLFAGCNITSSNLRSYKDLFDPVMSKLEQKRSALDRYRNLLDAWVEPTWRKRLFVGSLSYLGGIIDLVEAGLPFEIQKTGIAIPFSLIEQKEQLRLVKQSDSFLFGDEIMLVEEEIYEMYVGISHHLDLKRGTMLEKEIKAIEGWLSDISSLNSFSLGSLDQVKQLTLLKESSSLSPIFEELISRDAYIAIFRKVLESYAIQKDIVVDNRTSIYDGYDALYIPSSSTYDYLSLYRVINLISHEIETHFLIEHNNKLLLGSMRGGWNLYREEGLAMFNESSLWGEQYRSLGLYNKALLFLNEMYSVVNNKILFDAFFTLFNSPPFSLRRLLRTKRNYPFTLTGGQHKKITYYRGLSRLQKNNYSLSEFNSLYMGKLSFKEVDYVSSLGFDFSSFLKSKGIAKKIKSFILAGGSIQDISLYLESLHLDKKVL